MYSREIWVTTKNISGKGNGQSRRGQTCDEEGLWRGNLMELTWWGGGEARERSVSHELGGKREGGKQEKRESRTRYQKSGAPQSILHG